MKIFVFIIFWAVSNSTFGQYVEANVLSVENELQKVDSIFEDINNRSPQEIKEASKVLQNISFLVSKDIQKASSDSWVLPSEERLLVVKKWAQVITPHNKNLIEMSFINSRDERIKKLAYEARSLLDFTSADQTFKNQLLFKIEESDNTRVFFKAADLLMEHRALGVKVKQILVSKGESVPKDEQLRWAKGLTKYGITDGLSILLKDFERPIDYNDFKRSFKQREYSIAAALNLGNKPNILHAPFLELCDEVITNVPDYKNNFINMRNIAMSPPRRLIAKNGSGYLDDEVNSYPFSNLLEQSQQLGNKPQSKEKVSEEVESAEEKPTTFLWWVIGLVVLLAIVFFLLKGKTKR